MYQNIYYDSSKRKVHIWDDKNGHVMVPFKKYAYVKDSYGTHVSLYGDKLKKIYRWDKDVEGLFESDINPETRTLIDMYTESDEPSVGHKIMIRKTLGRMDCILVREDGSLEGGADKRGDNVALGY